MSFNFIKFKDFIPGFIFALCILEMMLANFIPLFPVRFLQIYVVYFLFIRLKNIKSFSLDDNGMIAYFIFVLLYIIAFFKTQNTYDTIMGEFANIVFWTIFGFIISLENKNDSLFFKNFILSISLVLFISSFGVYYLSITKGLNLYNNVVLDEYIMKDSSIIEGTSLNSDYNIFSLAICISVIFGLHILFIFKNIILKLIYWFSIPVVGLIIFFSGSRRGFLFFFITSFILIFYNNQIKGKTYSKKTIISYGFVALFTFVIFSNFESLGVYLESLGGNVFSGLRVLTLNSELVSENERTIRWDYFFTIFNNYSFSDVFFGKNFDYIELYGRKFNEIEDNPHNFIISTILYGGFLSILTLFFLMFLVTKNLIITKNYIFLIIFIFFIIFGLTSSNTLFSSKIPPVVITFALLNSNKLLLLFSKN